MPTSKNTQNYRRGGAHSTSSSLLFAATALVVAGTAATTAASASLVGGNEAIRAKVLLRRQRDAVVEAQAPYTINNPPPPADDMPIGRGGFVGRLKRPNTNAKQHVDNKQLLPQPDRQQQGPPSGDEEERVMLQWRRSDYVDEAAVDDAHTSDNKMRRHHRRHPKNKKDVSKSHSPNIVKDTLRGIGRAIFDAVVGGDDKPHKRQEEKTKNNIHPDAQTENEARDRHEGHGRHHNRHKDSGEKNAFGNDAHEEADDAKIGAMFEDPRHQGDDEGKNDKWKDMMRQQRGKPHHHHGSGRHRDYDNGELGKKKERERSPSFNIPPPPPAAFVNDALLNDVDAVAAGGGTTPPAFDVSNKYYAKLRQQVADAIAKSDFAHLTNIHTEDDGIREDGGGLPTDLPSAPATASFSTSFFNHLLGQVAQFINVVGRSIVIPPVEEKYYSTDPIHFQELTVEDITLATVAPNKLILYVDGLRITIPKTGVHVHASVVGCDGHMTAVVEGGAMAITVHLGNDGNGHINSTCAVATPSFQKITISHDFDGSMCKVADWIINLIVGGIDKKIAEGLKEQMPIRLAPAIDSTIKNAMQKVPIYVVGDPRITSDGMYVTIDLLSSFGFADGSWAMDSLPWAVDADGNVDFDGGRTSADADGEEEVAKVHQLEAEGGDDAEEYRRNLADHRLDVANEEDADVLRRAHKGAAAIVADNGKGPIADAINIAVAVLPPPDVVTPKNMRDEGEGTANSDGSFVAITTVQTLMGKEAAAAILTQRNTARSQRGHHGSKQHDGKKRHGHHDKSESVVVGSPAANGMLNEIGFAIPQESVNNIFAFINTHGFIRLSFLTNMTTEVAMKNLVPEAYERCKDCKMVVGFYTNATAAEWAPKVKFADGNVGLSVQRMSVAISGMHPATGVVVPFFTLNVDVALSLNGIAIRIINDGKDRQGISNLYFQLALQELAARIESSAVGPLPRVEQLLPMLFDAANKFIIPRFNQDFKGFDFPECFTNMHIASMDGILAIGTDLIF